MLILHRCITPPKWFNTSSSEKYKGQKSGWWNVFIYFQGVQGVVENSLEIPEGWGGYHCYPKMENAKGWGGPIWNSLRGGGMDIFWNYTISSNVIIWFTNLPFDKKTDNAAHVSVLCDAFISSQTWMILTERIVLFDISIVVTNKVTVV